MTTDDHAKSAPAKRLTSGIAGLDAIVGGGFLQGGVYMILGSPGVGKTILGNELCFRHAASGHRAVYVTLLTESHGRLLAHQASFDFFDLQVVGSSVYYISGYEALEKDKFKGLLDLVRKVVRQHDGTLLVIDGLVTAGSVAQSELELKKFIHELQVFVELVGCTALLLSGASGNEEQYPMRTMVDGLVRLRLEPAGMGAVRTIEIMKMRGGENILGRHFFEITKAGMVVHPRTEAVLGRGSGRPEEPRAPLAFGVASLDKMLGGGLRPGSVTMVLGSPGSGKTLLGLTFLGAGARANEPGLYFGFFETPAEIVRKANATDRDFARHCEGGLIELLWQPPLELIADALVERLLQAVRERGVRRLFIDGFGGFKDGLIFPERVGRFLSALSNELRSLGVAVMLSDETSAFAGPTIEVPIVGLTGILDNVVFLRQVELRARLHRLISVVKLREGVSDSLLHEFSITESGIDVSATFDSAEAILTGVARATSGDSKPPEPPAKKGPGKTPR